MSRTRMPALFLGHGSPMNVLEDNRYTRAWAHLGETLPRPKAIVVVSAHWFTRGTGVTAMEAPKTIHDFGGFPQALYDTHYPAPGFPALAQRLVELLSPVPVTLDKEAWGFDHGSWGVLIKMYPQADIPMVQLSIDLSLIHISPSPGPAGAAGTRGARGLQPGARAGQRQLAEMRCV